MNEERKDGDKTPQQDGLSEKFLKTRTILFSGEVDKESAEKAIRQLLLLAGESDEPIRFFIDSPGGDVDAGFAVYDMIRFIKPKVYTIAMGLAASAGALILLAAEKENRRRSSRIPTVPSADDTFTSLQGVSRSKRRWGNPADPPSPDSTGHRFQPPEAFRRTRLRGSLQASDSQ